MISEAQIKIDGAIAAGAIASPWWLWYFDHAMHVALVIGGFLLLTLRIVKAWRDLKVRRETRE